MGGARTTRDKFEMAFESLWRDMQRAPERLCPRFNSIEIQFFGRASAVEMLNVRLTPNMESKLYFILDGQPKTVGWSFLVRFKKIYLSSSESEWLIPDIIRYICALDLNLLINLIKSDIHKTISLIKLSKKESP